MTKNKDNLWKSIEGSWFISDEEIEKENKIMEHARKTADWTARMTAAELARAYGATQPLGRCLGKSVRAGLFEEVKDRLFPTTVGSLTVHNEVTLLAEDEMADIPDNVFVRPSSSAPPMQHLPPQSEIGKAIDKHLKSNLVDVTDCDYQRYERDWSIEACTYGIRSVGNINPPPEVLPVVHIEDHKKALARIDQLEKQMADLTAAFSALMLKVEAKPVAEPKKAEDSYWR